MCKKFEIVQHLKQAARDNSFFFSVDLLSSSFQSREDATSYKMSQKIASLVSLSHEDESWMNLGEAAINLSRSFFSQVSHLKPSTKTTAMFFNPAEEKKSFSMMLLAIMMPFL